tara:strand:- start:6295 stop:6474 length:180 start_codon:yes stop_codon:yes gene_type:complete
LPFGAVFYHFLQAYDPDTQFEKVIYREAAAREARLALRLRALFDCFHLLGGMSDFVITE